MSQAIITRFKVRQQSIIDTLDQVQMLARSYVAAKPKIREMNEKLLAHFAGQNDELFEQLHTYHRLDRSALKMIEFLIHDLKEIKVKYLIFFEKHSGGMLDMSARTFPKDFSDFAREITTRFKIEEEYLFPLLEKIPDG